MEDKKNKDKIPHVGMGLIFGTAIGVGVSLAITGTIVWAGIGTAIGLILGAIIQSYESKGNENGKD